MKTITLIGTLLTVFALLAATTVAQDMGDLAGTAWQLVAQGGESLTTDAPITLIFDEDNRAGGSGGCNTYGAGYSVEGANISFSAPMSTMIACAEDIMVAEQAYLAALEAAATYEHRDNQLVIRTGDGQELVFVPLVNLTGSAWTLVTLDGEAVSGTITLSFGDDGRVTGSGGCNSYGGSYSANAGELFIEQVVSTLMACADETINAQETAYFDALQGVTRYAISGDQLVITYGDEQELIFSQQIQLAGSQWQLVSYAGTDVLAETPITLQFEADNRVTGSGGCNMYRSSYTLTGEQISFSEIISTRRACPDEAGSTQEQAYFAALQAAVSYRIAGDQLVVTTASGDELIFEQAQGLTNTSWQLEMLGENAVIEGSGITLEFDSEGRAAGSGGCNQYSGSYSVSGESLSFSQVATTERACLDNDVMAQEQAYYAALGSTTTYTQTADQLTISYGEGQTLVFTPLASAENPQ